MAPSRPRPLSRRGSIDPDYLVPMDKTVAATGAGDNFNVIFIGAGNIMFGSDEGPWNHSFRLEHKLGPRLKVVALIDPAVERARAVLQKKRASFVVSAYQDTRIFKSLDEYVKNVDVDEEDIQAIVIGCPPMFRGSTKPGRNLELQIIETFPGTPLFVEKPVATGPQEEVAEAFRVAKAIDEAGTICSVGYMLRYLKAVQMMKQILDENNLTVMSTVARYAAAYSAIAKPDWWDKSKSYGPVIEQATHFCALVNPYVSPVLYVRSPGDDYEHVHRFENDDPFFSEVSNLIDVIEDGPESAEILSSYEDACKTYAFTWAIREASEKSKSKK
ncbi:hypothetical protein M422DRAFT_228745 [Sphaerobolus stellatus SS14]|uniref:Uncharacterized protein n=1 Tax=Sphaerobolus stellatus (strain SS14) TaxID=990650 RepID=A0A0C9VZT8_SPHS4|nr:hypothetical protein M422DRAFT_228745 [Sphaerobolus stellatus SS14]